MQDNLGVNVNVTNVVGVNGLPFFDEIANAEPDGTTIGFAPTNLMVSHLLEPDLHQTSPEDFSYVTVMEADPDIILAAPDAPFDTAEGLLDYEGTVRGALYSTLVMGQVSLAVLAQDDQYNFDIQPVTYSQVPEALAAVAGNDVDIMGIAASGTTKQAVEDGNAVPLFVWGDERTDAFPDIPTSNELGIPEEFEATRLHRPIVTTPETPPQTVDLLGDAVNSCLASPEIQEWGEEADFILTHISGDEYLESLHTLADLYKDNSEAVSEQVTIL